MSSSNSRKAFNLLFHRNHFR